MDVGAVSRMFIAFLCITSFSSTPNRSSMNHSAFRMLRMLDLRNDCFILIPTNRISLILGSIRVQKLRKCRLELFKYLSSNRLRIHLVFREDNRIRKLPLFLEFD